MSFGARLREERKRLRLKQAEFATLVRTDVPKQSLYENDHRELRAPYLARIAAAGVDIGYVLTGTRTQGPWLDSDARAFFTAYFRLSGDLQAILVRFVAELSHCGGSGVRTPDP